jgi:hypothetical protein
MQIAHLAREGWIVIGCNHLRHRSVLIMKFLQLLYDRAGACTQADYFLRTRRCNCADCKFDSGIQLLEKAIPGFLDIALMAKRQV